MKILCIATAVPSLLMGEDRAEQAHEDLMSFADPGTQLFWSEIEKGTGNIEQNFQRELAATYIMKQILEVDENVYDGVIICCGLEPCLVAAREYLKIPVVGALTAGVSLASMLGRKFSVIHPKSPGGNRAMRDSIRVMNMEARLASIRGTTIPLADWHALPITKQVDEVIIEARKAIDEDGADVIILGCGAMQGFQTLSEKLGVPVIYQPVAALKMCELMVKLGLSHSKVAYPRPSKAIPWNVFD